MKKLIILIALATSILSAYSQPAVTAGFTLSNNCDDIDESSKFVPGFNAGFTFDIGDDTRHYAFRPGIAFITKGWRLDGVIDEKQTYVNYMVQIPIRFVHKIRLSDDLRLELGYGCYLDFGIDGNVKVEYPELTGDYVINGEKQTVHYDKIEKKFPGKLYGFDNGPLFHAGLSSNRIYGGVTYQGGWRGINAFLFNVGYFLKPCHERSSKPKSDSRIEYLYSD